MDCNNYYTHKLRILQHDIKILFDSEFEKLGITGQQGVFLIYLCRNGSAHQNDLEQTFGLSKSTVSGILKRMLKKELITKESDYPYVTIKPTNNAIELLEKMGSAREEINERLLKGFSSEEKQSLTNMIDRMIANVKEVK